MATPDEHEEFEADVVRAVTSPAEPAPRGSTWDFRDSIGTARKRLRGDFR